MSVTAKIRTIKDELGNVFYPLTDINAIVSGGEKAIESKPTKDSDGIVTSGGIYNEIYKNVYSYDISAGHNGAVYNSLSEALGQVPEQFRKGGMEFQFLMVMPNNEIKYVHYFYSGQYWGASDKFEPIGRMVHITEDAYNALSEDQKNNGDWYFIEEEE